MTRLLLTVSLAVLCGNLYAQQTTIYVSPTGSDAGGGSLSSPLKTLSAALGKMASCKTPGVHILLREGRYAPDTTLEITPILLAGHTLEIAAYRHEKVTISGAVPVLPHWEPWKGCILKAFIGEGLSIDQLLCNGRILPMARYPNFDSSQAIYNGTAADAISPERVKTWGDPAGGYVHGLHQGMWGSFDYRIMGKDSSGNLQLEGGWQNNRPAPMHKQYRFVENIFEELDAPGEWFYNSTEGILYLYPPPGINLATALFERSRLNDILIFKGSAKDPVMNVIVKDIAFTGTNRTFMLTKEPLLRSDWTVYRGGAILIDGCKNITIRHCTFSSLGGNALFVSNYNRNIVLSDNDIHDIGASAIAFVGNPDAVRSPSFRYDQSVPPDRMDMTRGPKSDNYPAECTAYDNLIHHIGAIEKQATGVQISMSMDIIVSHNTIYNVPRAGINVGDGCWGGDMIEFNDVFNTVLETGDHGAFNSWGRDRYWLPDTKAVDSIVERYPGLPLLDAIKPITLRNNRFSCLHGWDIDLDDGSTHYHIYDNVCLNGGLKLREGFDRIVENNVLVNNTFHPHVWYKNSNDIFRYNIVSADYAPIRIDYWGKEVDSNFFLQQASLEAARLNHTDAHSLYGDPRFVNALVRNYQVQPTSKALKVGFTNFPMNQFGVVSPDLKSLAAKPVIPSLRIIQSPKWGRTTTWLGATVKDVETLGEQSAAGLPDRNGVMILRINTGSVAAKSGLTPGDVIRKIGDSEVLNVSQMLTLLKSFARLSETPAVIIHNQTAQTIRLYLGHGPSHLSW